MNDTTVAAGITDAIVDFDGEGDSGQIDSVTAQSDGRTAELPDTQVTIHTVTWGREITCGTRDCGLSDAVVELCYGFLEHEHGGWENNDGAYGEFRFDVRARTIELEFNARYSDVFTETSDL